VLLVKGLGDAEGRLGREAEASVAFALEGREIEEARGAFLLGLTFVGDDADAEPERFFGDLAGLGFVVETFGFLAVGHAGNLGGAAVAALGDPEIAFDLPEGLRDEITDLELTLHQEHERRGLDAPDGEDVALGAADADGAVAAAVHADQPVGLRAADGGTEEAGLGRLWEQVGEGFGDGRVRHAREPQPADRQAAFRQLVDIMEDQLAFPAGVAGVHDFADVRSGEELLQQLEAVAVVTLADDDLQDAGAGGAVEVIREDGQILQRPALELLVEVLRVVEADDVADRGADHPLVVLEVVTGGLGHLGHLEHLRQIGRDGRLLGDDEGLGAGGSGGFGGGLG
jgi:hypothetical protein